MRNWMLAVAAGAAGGFLLAAVVFAWGDPGEREISAQRRDDVSSGADGAEDLSAAQRELECLRAEATANRKLIADLRARVDGQSSDRPSAELPGPEVVFRKEQARYVKWLAEPLKLESRSPAEEAARVQNFNGLVCDSASRLSGADFTSFIVANARWRVARVEQSIGRRLSDGQRAAIEQTMEQTWESFRDWRQTTYLERVRTAQSMNELNELKRDLSRRLIGVKETIQREVSDLFRDGKRDRAVREKVLLYF